MRGNASTTLVCLGRTPLFMAAETGCLRIVRMLADHGADTRSRETQRRGSTQVRSTNGKLTGLAQFLGPALTGPS